MNIQDKLRLQTTKRWTIVPTSIPQSVADHSWGVAAIAWEIGKRTDQHPAVMSHLISHALFHDLAEARTGDIPTPTKEKLGESIVQNMMEKVYFDPGTTYGVKVVKYADLLESVYFIQNYGVGRLAYRVRVLLTLRLLERIEQEEEEDIKEAVNSILHDFNQGDFEI